MCGRYSLIAELSQLALRFDFAPGELVLAPRYNVAPTQATLTVVRGAGDGGDTSSANQARLMRWGLIPSWAREPSAVSPLINARAETLTEKPSFRRALERRRCLVLADGFYEWQIAGKQRQPQYVSLASGEPFAMAGLWERWRPPAGAPVYSCAIVTTSANPLLEPIHPRMPVILPPDLEAAWLDPEATDAGLLTSLLTPYPAGAMQCRRVSPFVNSAASEGPECLAPAADLKLF